jgi:hypothetical protein
MDISCTGGLRIRTGSGGMGVQPEGVKKQPRIPPLRPLLHPNDEDLSLGAPVRRTPVGMTPLWVSKSFRGQAGEVVGASALGRPKNRM